jgi:2-keto-3-deoxy-L-rhamnonate aldolase RhmA
MLRNKVKEVLDAGGMAIGTWVEMRNPEACEAAAASGFDFIVMDGEHGSFGVEGAVELIRAVEAGGSTPILRLPDSSPTAIQKALEAGAVGVFISEVRTGEEAAQIVRATKYAPAGTRGSSPHVRCTMHGARDWKEYAEWAKENLMVWVMIENTDAVKNIESILSSGVDAILIGSFDLSMSMGLEGNFTHPDVVEAQDRVVQLALSKGVDVAVNLDLASLGARVEDIDLRAMDQLGQIAQDRVPYEPEEFLEAARLWRDKGCRIATAQTDRQILTDTYRKLMAAFQKL